jgi:hypothetical protein
MIDAATQEFIAGRTVGACVDDACALLCEGLFARAGSSTLSSVDIANGWLRAPLPARQYRPSAPTTRTETIDGAWVMREFAHAATRRELAQRRVTFAPTTTTPKSTELRTVLLDTATAVAVGRTGVRESTQTNDERELIVRVDVESETVVSGLLSAQRQAIVELREISERAVTGSLGSNDQFISIVARTWLVLALEPVRLRIVLELNAPDSLARRLDIERALYSLRARRSADDDNAPLDPMHDATVRYVQNNIAHLTVHLFSGCPELGVSFASLGMAGQRGCAFLTSAASVLFDAAACRIVATHESLDGFRYNEQLDAALDRTRLIVGVCRAVLGNEDPERFEHCQSILRATLDDALTTLLSMPQHTEKQLLVLQEAIAQVIDIEQDDN